MFQKEFCKSYVSFVVSVHPQITVSKL